MTRATHYFTDFRPAAVNESLSWCSKHPDGWYKAENVVACEQLAPRRRIGNKLWPTGYFAVIEYIDHDEMRDFQVNKRDSRPVAGPFPTEDEALDAACMMFDEIRDAMVRA